MKEDVRAQYDCPACGAASAVIVLGIEVLGPPETDLHRELEASVGENRLAQLKADKRKSRATAGLLFATCPRCGARNPAGVIEARKRRSISAGGGAALYVLMAVLSWPWPSVLLVSAALGSITIVMNLVRHLRREPARTLRITSMQLVVVAIALALWTWAPAWAPLFCLVGAAEAVRSSLSIPDEWFERGARDIRFDPDATAYRG